MAGGKRDIQGGERVNKAEDRPTRFDTCPIRKYVTRLIFLAQIIWGGIHSLVVIA